MQQIVFLHVRFALQTSIPKSGFVELDFKFISK